MTGRIPGRLSFVQKFTSARACEIGVMQDGRELFRFFMVDNLG